MEYCSLRDKYIDEIRNINSTASIRFLRMFKTKHLEAYLDRLIKSIFDRAVKRNKKERC